MLLDRKTVEHGLDYMLMRICVCPDDKHFEIMAVTLAELEQKGYIVKEYKEMWEELAKEFDYSPPRQIPVRRAKDIDLSEFGYERPY